MKPPGASFPIIILALFNRGRLGQLQTVPRIDGCALIPPRSHVRAWLTSRKASSSTATTPTLSSCTANERLDSSFLATLCHSAHLQNRHGAHVRSHVIARSYLSYVYTTPPRAEMNEKNSCRCAVPCRHRESCTNERYRLQECRYGVTSSLFLLFLLSSPIASLISIPPEPTWTRCRAVRPRRLTLCSLSSARRCHC